MFPLVESLKLKDGFILNMEYHQDRMNRSMSELFPFSAGIVLKKEILIPENCLSGLFKIRLSYGRNIGEIDIEPYVFRQVQSLKIVHHESLDYHLKYSDRHILQDLFDKRGNCDDILIVKDGFVSDSFTANILFYDRTKWFTPSSPLLKGTKRQFLLDQGLISEREIREADIWSYQKVGLINAMIDFGEMPVIPVELIL